MFANLYYLQRFICQLWGRSGHSFFRKLLLSFQFFEKVRTHMAMRETLIHTVMQAFFLLFNFLSVSIGFLVFVDVIGTVMKGLEVEAPLVYSFQLVYAFLTFVQVCS